MKLKNLVLAVSLGLSFAASAVAGTYTIRVPVKGLVPNNASTPTACSAAPVVLSYTGSAVPVALPSGCTKADIKMWGAGGASGNLAYNGAKSAYYSIGGKGGGGGFVSVSLAGLTPQNVLTFQVGKGGLAPIYIDPNYPGYSYAGTGGGRTDVTLNGVLVAVAGAGGGGGGGADHAYMGAPGGHAGAGGTAAGDAAGNGTDGYGGYGGGKSGANGAVGSYNGSSLRGGTECTTSANPIFPAGGTFCNGTAGNILSGNYGGMGGDGYIGGGAGGKPATPYVTGGGGGGGSSYVAAIPQVARSQQLGGTSTTPGNASDSDRAGAGVGGALPTSATGNSGTAGRVVITFS